jgi:predicted AAA+ superfamily ATPase
MEDLRINTANFVVRERYLGAIEAFIDQPVVKVLKGMRRVGKSVIMRLLIEQLINSGVPGANILYINKESLEFDAVKDYRDLHRYAVDYFKDGVVAPGRKYILIDEIQEIEGWERSVASFLADGLGDVVISGSNASLLSSELATLISGRYVEIPVYPLTFREFLTFRKNKKDKGDGADKSAEAETNTETEFKNYLRYGGLPGIHQLPFNDEVIFSYLNSILNTVLYKDVITRHKIRDASIFDKLVRYLFDNVGNITTAKKVADYFKSQRIRTSVDTVLNYINYVEASLLIDKAPRYDIKGRRLLEFFDKVFLNDIGLRHGLIGYRERDINGLLENIVFKELQARGYKMSIGVIDQMEIDFIAEKQNDKKYIQVCYSLGSEAAIEREFGNLEKIKDNYEKMVISMDRFFPAERNGIIHRYVIDFLLE